LAPLPFQVAQVNQQLLSGLTPLFLMEHSFCPLDGHSVSGSFRYEKICRIVWGNSGHFPFSTGYFALEFLPELL